MTQRSEPFDENDSKSEQADPKLDALLALFQFEETDGGVAITDLNEEALPADGEIVVPAELHGRRVVEIAKSAFNGYDEIKSVTLPFGVKKIGSLAFWRCSSLDNVFLPHGIESIGAMAFADCSSLKGVAIPESVDSIAEDAFNNCPAKLFFIVGSYAERWARQHKRGYEAIEPVRILLDKETEEEFSPLVNAYGIFFWKETEGGVEITGFDENHPDYDDEIVIPPEIQGKDVVRIGASAFEDSRSLIRIVIPETVCELGENAFAGCSSLKSAVIPSGVREIPNAAFSDCSALINVVLPEGVEIIGDWAFAGCQSLVKIDDHIDDAEIEQKTFWDTGRQPTLFEHCRGRGRRNARQKTFWDWGNTSSAALPKSLMMIGEGAFWGCCSLEEIVVPKTVEVIDQWAFAKCDSLASVEIPSAVKTIKHRTFSDCFSLSKVVLHEGLETIDEEAFNNCSELTSLSVPRSVQEIGTLAFVNCSAILRVYRNSYAERWALSRNQTYEVIDDPEELYRHEVFYNQIVITGVDPDLIPEDGALTVPTELDGKRVVRIGKHAFENVKALTSVVVGDGVVTIGEHAFAGCDALRNVELPPSVLEIGEGAFYNCTNLTSALVPKGVATISSDMFRGCSRLVNVALPNSVTFISSSAFRGCTLLEKINIPSGVKAIGASAFAGCASLKSVDLPESVALLEASAFLGCSSLEVVVIADEIETLSANVFASCSALSSVTLPETIREIGSNAFYDCRSLIKLVLPKCVANIAENAFDLSPAKLVLYEGSYAERWAREHGAAYELKRFYLFQETSNGVVITGVNRATLPLDGKIETPATINGKPVVAIGQEAFVGWDSLESAVISEGVTTISERAFARCAGLTNIVLPESLCEIGMGAFARCYALDRATIPDNVESIGDAAFEMCPAKLVVFRGSFAEDWAKSKGRETEEVGVSTRMYLVEDADDGVVITGVVESRLPVDGKVVIPEKIRGKRVVGIGQAGFKGLRSITDVVIPEGVREIAKEAFWGCSSLANIVFPETLKRIGHNAFFDCRALAKIVIPSGVQEIDSKPFYSNKIEVDVRNPFFTSEDGVLFDKNRETLLYVPNQKTLETYSTPQSVRAIGIFAFASCASLKRVFLSNNVKSIAYGAFSNCSSLSKIVVPEGVTTINGNTFNKCSSLIEIALSEGTEKIGGGAFQGCSSLKEIVIPKSVHEIAVDAFKECSAVLRVHKGSYAETWAHQNNRKFEYVVEPNSWLQFQESKGELTLIGLDCSILPSDGKISVPRERDGKRVVAIGLEAFKDCGTLTSVVIEEGIEAIGAHAFHNCVNLSNVVIPNSVKSISNGAFWGCRSLTGVVVPEGIKTILNGVFYDCEALTNVLLPNDAEVIGNGAFKGCRSLTNITLPHSVVSIGARAFADCRALTSLALSKCVRSIMEDAFENCPAKLVVFEGSYAEDWACKKGRDYITKSWYCFEDASGGVVLTSVDRTNLPVDGKIVVPAKINGRRVVGIGSYAFVECDSITSVEISNGVETIESGAFAFCAALRRVIIPESVKKIGANAFSSCLSLTRISLPRGLNDIDESAFDRLPATIEVYAGSYAESWAKAHNRPYELKLAFLYEEVGYGMVITGFDNASLPKDGKVEIPIKINDRFVVEIGDHAFVGNSALKEVVIPNSVERIGANAFCGSGLTNAMIPEGVEKIGDYAFQESASLTSVVISKGVTTIGIGAFFRCAALSSVFLANSVARIGSMAFLGCASLRKLVIPSSVRSIGADAFEKNCVVDVDPENAVYSSEFGALFDKRKETLLHVPSVGHIYSQSLYVVPQGVKTIADRAFFDCSFLQNISLPEGLQTIGDAAFANCSSLASLVVPSTVRLIADKAFEKCPAKLLVHSGSYAERWARENRRLYEVVAVPSPIVPAPTQTPFLSNSDRDARSEQRSDRSDRIVDAVRRATGAEPSTSSKPASSSAENASFTSSPAIDVQSVLTVVSGTQALRIDYIAAFMTGDGISKEKFLKELVKHKMTPKRYFYTSADLLKVIWVRGNVRGSTSQYLQALANAKKSNDRAVAQKALDNLDKTRTNVFKTAYVEHGASDILERIFGIEFNKYGPSKLLDAERTFIKRLNAMEPTELEKLAESEAKNSAEIRALFEKGILPNPWK